MMSPSLTRCACALVAAIGAAIAPASAQSVEPARSTVATDTAGVLEALAALFRGRNAEPWFVAPGDTLTVRLAALAGVTTVPTPPGAVCGFDAPQGATVASTTALMMSPASPATVYASLYRTCRRTRQSAVGSQFAQVEMYRVIRRGRAWTAAPSGRGIT
jgi:hypothetical protein